MKNPLPSFAPVRPAWHRWVWLLAALLLLGSGHHAQAQPAPAYPPTGYRWSFATNPSNGNGTLEATSVATTTTGTMYAGGFTRSATTVNGVGFPTPPAPRYSHDVLGTNGFVGKLSSAGAWQWLRAIGNSSCRARVEQVVTDAQGRVYAVGTMLGTMIFSPTVTLECEGDEGAFVVCYDANGAFQWATQAHYDDIVSTTPTTGIGLAVREAGNATEVFVTGTFNGRARFGNSAIDLTTPYQHHHTFVGKLSGATGAWQWVRQAGTTSAGTAPDCGVASWSNLTPGALVVDAAGNAYFAANYSTSFLPKSAITGVAGPFSFRTDQSLLIGKISANGAWQWLKTESNYDGKLTDLSVSPNGQHVAVVGQTGSGNNIGYTSNPPFCQTPVSTAYSGYPDGYNQPGLTLGTQLVIPNNSSFVASLSAAGTWEWANRVGNSVRNADRTFYKARVAHSAAGEIFHVTGPTVQRQLATGEPLDNQPVPGSVTALAFDPAGNMLIAGSFTSFGTPNGLLMRSARVPEPTITSFTPTQGPAGTVVTITGTNFENVLDTRAVVSAAPYMVNSSTQITATIPILTAGTTPIVVQTASGLAVSAGLYTVIVPPADVTFSPGFGSVGTPVTLRGTGFTGATLVKFGGTTTANFTIVSDGEITVRVPSMGLGLVKISVMNPAGTGISAANFGVGVAPTISGISPATGAAGTSFTITGTALGGATGVRIGAAPCTILTNTATAITATVPNALAGAVSVTTPYGTATGPTFSPTAPVPAISGFSPGTGPAGTSVTLTGTNLNWVAEARVNGVPATISSASAGSLTLVVPDASTGPISVTGPGGTAVSATSFVIPVPTAPTWAWAKTSGSTGASAFQLVRAIAADAQGNTYVAGSFGAIATFGALSLTASGIQDGFIAKQAANGNWVWAVKMGGAGTDEVRGLHVSANGVVTAVGSFEQTMTVGPTSLTSLGGTDVFAAFLNADGTARTAYRAGSTANDVATAVCREANGTAWVVGNAAVMSGGAGTVAAFGPAAFASRGNGDVFLTRLTEAEGFTSVCSAGGTDVDQATAVAVSPAGRLAVAGNFRTTFGLGYYYPAGARGGTDSFVATTTTAQATTGLWGQLLLPASTADDAATAVQFDASENLVAAGTFQGTLSQYVPDLVSAGGTDGYFVRYSSIGVLFATRIGGSGNDDVRSMIVDGSSNFTLTGQFTGDAAFGATALAGSGGSRDLYVARLSPTGTWLWAARAGGVQNEAATAAAFDAAGNVVIGGVLTSGVAAAFGALPAVTSTNGLVTAKLGTATVPAPTISGFTPTSGPRGTMVTVTGTNLGSVNDIEFVGGPDYVNYQDITGLSNTALTFPVPAGATTGAIRVTTAGGTAQTATSFSVTGPTNIVFSPATGLPGTLVTILGTGFTNVTAVRFGGVALPVTNYTVVSTTTIRAYVDGASVTGPVSVVTAVGTGTSAATFTVIPGPTITGISPTSGPVGTVVTITGTHFTGATRVRLGAEDVDGYTVVSPTSITAVVPDSVANGWFSVEVGGSVTATFGTTFTVTQPAPTISGFTPTSGPTGTTVTITGTDFTLASEVSFNNVVCPAGTWQALSTTSIVANVPATATTGRLRVTTPGGTAVSSTDFAVTAPPAPPTLTGFTPGSGPVGTSVTLTGSALTGATAVSFNGTAATSFTVNTATQITTTVPAGATDGPISVTTPGGTTSTAGAYDVTTPSASGWPTSVTSSGNSQAAATVTDASGNVYVAGFFNGTASFANLSATTATESGFVVKYNSAGVGQWVRVIGNAGQVHITGLDVDANGSVYVAGTFTDPFTYAQGTLSNPNGTTQRGFVGQLAPNGIIQFLTGFGGTQPIEVRDVVVDLNGVIYVGGMFQHLLGFDLNPQLNLSGSGATDGYVAALNTGSGQWMWATRCGGSGSDDLTGLAIDRNAQALYACGTFENGSFSLTGVQQPLTNLGSIDLWVARMSLGGAGVWLQGGASNSADYARDVAVTAQGTVYVAVSGFATGTLGPNTLTPTNASGYAAVARLSPGGTWLTGVAVAGGGASASFFNYVLSARLAVGADGAATLTGYGGGQTLFGATTLPAGDGNFYAFAARTSTAGTGWQWAQALTDGTGVNQSYGAAVALAPTGPDAYVAGTFSGSMMLDGVTLTTGSFVNNAYVARVAPPAGPPAAPTVTALSPTAGPTGTVVTFTGTNLTGATAVSFNGQAATFGSLTATSLTATVPATATSGPVSVTTPGGTVAGPAFAVTASVPVITSFSPASGPVGTSVTLSGQHLGLATAVRFNGTLAAIIGNTATLLTVEVPAGATDGPISVTTSGGTGTSATPFDVTGPTNTPVITAISPTHAPEGATVTISGQFLTTATQVRFNGMTASFYVSGQNLMVQVPVGATSGTVAVTTPVDDAGSSQPFQLDLVIVSDQQVPFGLYYDVTVQPGATATLTGALIDVSHSLTVRSGATLDFGGGVITGAGSFTSETNATLIIRQNAGLTTSPTTQGDVQVAGLRTFAAAADYVYAGTTQQTGAALPATVRNLTVETGADVTLTQPLGIQRVLRLNGTGNLRTNGQTFTLLSDASGTAMLVNSGAGRVIGTATVQRFLTADVAPGLGYRHLSSPVVAAPISDLAVPGSFTPVVNAAYNAIPTPTLPATQTPTVFGFDETRGGAVADFGLGWFSPTALTDVLQPGRGYSVLMRPVKPDFVGTLNQEEFTVSNLTRTGSFAGNADKSGWHLLGNPYPSPLDWDLVPIPAGLSASISVYKSQGGNNGVYLIRANGIGSLQDGVLPTAQAFFTRVTGANPVSLTLPTAARVTTYDNPAHYRAAAENRPVLRLSLRATGAAANLTDDAFVYFEAGATENLDDRFDGMKPGYNPGNVPTLVSLTPTGEALAVNGLPEHLRQTGIALPLLLVLPTTGSYELAAADMLNLPEGATLEDALTGTVQPLTAGSLYTFRAAAGELRNRFTLHLGQRVLGMADAETSLTALQLWPNPARGSVRVTLPRAATRLSLTDALGRTVRDVAMPTGAADTTLELRGLSPGIYTVRCGSQTQRLAIE